MAACEHGMPLTLGCDDCTIARLNKQRQDDEALIQRMLAALEEARAVASVACREGCWQPVFTLVSVGLRDDLAAWLAAGEGSVGRWLQRHRPVPVEFPDRPGLFRNINTPEELARLEAEWGSLEGAT